MPSFLLVPAFSTLALLVVLEVRAVATGMDGGTYRFDEEELEAADAVIELEVIETMALPPP